jgi:iron(III) transport system substrate-binding protein
MIAAAALSAACSLVAPASITIYSGRTEDLIGPLIERFEEQTGVDAQVRYGDTAELASLLLEEGAATPADVYIAQDAGALGAVAGGGLLRQLPTDVLDRVPASFRSPDGHWVGVSARARVVVYDTRELSPEQLPTSIHAHGDARP